jgi:hypothetical protein
VNSSIALRRAPWRKAQGFGRTRRGEKKPIVRFEVMTA